MLFYIHNNNSISMEVITYKRYTNVQLFYNIIWLKKWMNSFLSIHQSSWDSRMFWSKWNSNLWPCDYHLNNNSFFSYMRVTRIRCGKGLVSSKVTTFMGMSGSKARDLKNPQVTRKDTLHITKGHFLRFLEILTLWW